MPGQGMREGKAGGKSRFFRILKEGGGEIPEFPEQLGAKRWGSGRKNG